MNETSPLPLEKLPIIFETLDGVVHRGTYLPEEQMFFIGFDENGEFRFVWEVQSWEYIMQ